MQRSQIKRGDKLKFLFAVRIISHLFREGLKALKKIHPLLQRLKQKLPVSTTEPHRLTENGLEIQFKYKTLIARSIIWCRYSGYFSLGNVQLGCSYRKCCGLFLIENHVCGFWEVWRLRHICTLFSLPSERPCVVFWRETVLFKSYLSFQGVRLSHVSLKGGKPIWMCKIEMFCRLKKKKDRYICFPPALKIHVARQPIMGLMKKLS